MVGGRLAVGISLRAEGRHDHRLPARHLAQDTRKHVGVILPLDTCEQGIQGSVSPGDLAMPQQSRSETALRSTPPPPHTPDQGVPPSPPPPAPDQNMPFPTPHAPFPLSAPEHSNLRFCASTPK